ncbi:DUF3943 domain-containing protein [Bacteroides sp. 214]|uniref:DUF3943 domain-containing protein n=1 Tax=Bacteroides sp. 214 TaxID=2302935 RepID=UPI0013D583B9|nr:DUF3943 domain-containing protein [Bacteroides sp. 214]NDW11340.1 DUF3943 domain-containing protein [Bacteroides sp. 214]
MKKELRLIFFLFVICATFSQAQIAFHHSVLPPLAPDSIDLAYYKKKHPLRATALNLGLNLGVWAFDRYCLEADYAYINMKTIKHNFKKGFVFDNDQMGTNMFLHPYHGSLYYNAARSNGYNFWQSGLYSLGGSFVWEMFMENERPSTNDIIATPIGGMALGEMFYRVSDAILNDTKTGKARFGRELASFIISPTRGLTRILTGDAWKKRQTTGKQFGVPDVTVMLSLGVRALELKDEIFDKGTGIATEIDIEYGDRFDAEKKQPYDYFSVRASLNIHSSQPILGQLNVTGRLLGVELVETEKRSLNLGMFQHFDYYDSDTISSVSAQIPYKFCTPASVGIGAIYKLQLSKNWELDAFNHINGVIIGASLSDHYRVEERNYNLASGFATKNGVNVIYKKDILALTANYEMYRMYTWKGYPKDIDWEHVDAKNLNAQGDVSKAILHATNISLHIKLKNKLYLTTSFSNYIRDTNYKYFEDVYSRTSEGKLMLSWVF